MTILNEYIDTNCGFASYLFIFLAVFSFIMIVYFLITGDEEDRNICCAFMFLIIICVVLALACVEKVPTYEVLLDDQYTAKEFFDSYTFIEKKGDIYVVREIEKEEEE